MSNKLFPPFAFLGLILVLIPLPWHLHAWNAGTCLFMIWTAVGCLIHFVNSIVWDGNLELHSAVWCDIATKLIVGLSVALPCASLCINRRLFLIARVSQVYTTRAEKWRAVCIDLAIGVGLPVIVMALHYIVQGHRFDIFEDIGCWPATVNMAPAYPLVWMWPILIGLISMVYCGLSLHALLQRRNEFNKLLTTNHNLSINHYFRLMALATTEIVTTTPIAIYFLYLNLTTSPPIPWVSLADTHFNFSRITYIPAFIVNSQPQLKLNFNLNRWLFPMCALLFFAFFGLAEDARRNYKRFFCAIVKPSRIVPRPRAIVGRSPHLIVRLPSTRPPSVYERSESSAKWDTLSHEMPEIKEDTPTPIVTPQRVSLADTIKSFPHSHGPAAPPISLDEYQWSPLDSSVSSSMNSVPSDPSSATQTLSRPAPKLIISHPDSDSLHFDSSPAKSAVELPPAPLRQNNSRSPSRHSNHRQSTSSDLQISISPPYFSEPVASLRHENPLIDQHPSATSDADYVHALLPHNGVRVTVETSVA